MKSRLLLLAAVVVLVAGCANQSPQSQSGRKLKLETVQHDFATTYVYR